MRVRFSLAILLLLTTGLAAQCAPTTGRGGEPEISVTEPYGQTAMAGGNGVIYLKLVNKGGSADSLLKVETQAAEAAELHETTIDANDVMRMRPLAKVDVPAGETVNLEPGGKHIMLLKLKQELKAGETIKLSLTFEKSGPLTVEAGIREVGAAEHMMDHSESNQ